jgi:putative phosphoesterase
MPVMKIGVIADTHGLVRPEVLEAFEGVDLILHAGDIGGKDVITKLEAIAPVKAVAGNVDTDLISEFDQELNFPLKNRRFLLRHIFKDIPMDADKKQVNVTDVIVYGHTHKPLIHQKENTLYLNPGAAGPRRFNLPVTVGLLTLNKSETKSEIIYFSK